MNSNHVAHLTDARPEHGHYDALVVGARAAGSSTAMLLARHGLRVLVVDRSAYGSDTLSSHALMRGAVDRLHRWGLLPRVLATDTPVIERSSFCYDDDELVIDIKPSPGVPGLIAPRRTVLDPVLVDAARDAGAEVLHDTKLVAIDQDAGGRVTGARLELADGTTTSVASDLLIGADGLRSSVARALHVPITRRGAHCAAYTVRYYDGLDVDRHAFGFEYRAQRSVGVIPTSNGATCIFTAMPANQFNPADIGVHAIHDSNLVRVDRGLAVGVRRASPAGPMRSWPGAVAQFRKACGPGWALVGDAGYFKDPFAAHGITDAFRDAELLTDAVVDGDLGSYERERDELSMPLFSILEQIASFEWTSETLPALHFALAKAMKAEDAATADRCRPARALAPA